MASRKYTSLPITQEYPVATGNFDSNRLTIDTIVLHTTVGTIQGTAARFANASSKVSAHYAVGLGGELYAFLEEYYVAYANGNYNVNQRAISIEHVDDGDYNSPRPNSLYSTSAKLVADICKFYGIACDNQHVLRHQHVSGASTACPDSLDTDRIINEAKQIISGGIITPPTTIKCEDLLKEKEVLITQLKAEISTKDRVITSKDQEITKLNSTINGKNEQISNLGNDLNSCKSQLSQCQSNTGGGTGDTAALQKQIDELKKTNAQLVAKVDAFTQGSTCKKLISIIWDKLFKG